MNEIVMPKLSDTMTEGRIVSWNKRVGEAVRRGDVLAEVETDKANMELEAFAQGVLLEIRVQAGEMAQVGTVIAVIGKADETVAPAAQPAAAPEGEAAAAPRAEAAAEEGGAEPAPAAAAEEAASAGPGEPAAQAKVVAQEPKLEKAMEIGGFQAVEGAPPKEEAATVAGVTPPEVEAAPAAAPGAGEAPSAARAEAGEAPGQAPESRERAAPVVRRKARELGIDLSQIKGSGPDGRILLQDLEQAQAAAGRPASPSPPAATEAGAPPSRPAAAGEPGGEGAAPMSRLRAAVAKTVSESWRNIPHFTVTMAIAMDDAESLRRRLKENGLALTVNDVVVKGVALALQGFPRLNASFAEGGINMHNEINIGVAVGVPEGVLMPVIPGCQGLSLLQISERGRALVERARSGSLSEQDMSGGTFSVSNLGMYGVSQFTALIYPSQAAVLAVGAVVDSPVVRAGIPVSAKMMQVTLCADHRVVDGAYVAQFLAELKKILENPVRLLV